MKNQKRTRWLYSHVIWIRYNLALTSFRACLLPRWKYRPQVMLFSILILMHLVSSNIRAQRKVRAQSQGSITAIEKNFRPVLVTKKITCKRHDTQLYEPQVTVPMKLMFGDDLVNKKANLTVKIRCGNSVVVVLTGPFHVRIVESTAKGCTFKYSSSGGEANVSAAGPTNVQSGEYRLATSHTRYGIKTIRGKKGLTREWLLYEGEATVESPTFTRTVSSGQKLVNTRARSPSTQQITPKDFLQAATAYARVDASQANISNPKELRDRFLKLRTLHQGVLKAPYDEEKRRLLENEQKSLGIPIAQLPPTQDYLLSLINQRRYSEAIEGFNKRLSQTVADSKDHHLAALAHGGLENTDSSITFARLAVDLDAKDNRLSEAERAKSKEIVASEQNYFFDLLNKGRSKDAIAGFEKRIRENRFNSRDYGGMAAGFQQLGETSRSVDFALEALARNKGDQQLSRPEHADCERIANSEQDYLSELIRQGKYDQAIDRVQSRIRAKLGDSRYFYWLVVVSDKLGRTDEAVAYGKQALDLNRSDRRLLRQQYDFCVSMTDEQVGLFRMIDQGKYNQAIEGFQRRVKEGRENSRDYWGMVLGFQQLGDTPRSIDAALEAIARNSDQRLSSVERANCEKIAASELDYLFGRIKQRKYDEALERLRMRMIQKRRDSRDPYALALVSEGTGDTDRAVAHARKALELDKADPRLLREQYDDCVRITNRKSEQPPEPADEQAELFKMIDQGMYKDAIDGFEKRVKYQRGNSRDRYGISLCFERLGEERLAIRYAREALEIDDGKMSAKERDDCRRIARVK